MSIAKSLAASLIGSMTLIATAATAHQAMQGGRKLHSSLTGAAEPAGGDPDGSGTAELRVNPGKNRLCYTLTVSGIAPATAAHIHLGAAGASPPNNLVLALATPTGGSSSGCASVPHQLALRIVKFPARYYVNVHNAEYAAGAVRGQLGK